MSPTLQSWAQVLSLGAIIVGALLYQTHYIDKVIEGLRNEINARFSTVDERFKSMEERFAGLRAELKAEIAGLRTELKAEIVGLRAELKAEIAGLRAEMEQRFDNLDTRLDRIEHPVVRG
jgi:chaperonin cofactor prefoldin